jgi:hypothetical protein
MMFVFDIPRFWRLLSSPWKGVHNTHLALRIEGKVKPDTGGVMDGMALGDFEELLGWNERYYYYWEGYLPGCYISDID